VLKRYNTILVEFRVGLYVALSGDHLAAGISAKASCDHCMSAVHGGKGGGKADLANASFPFTATTTTSLLDGARTYLSSR
jgi:alanyl-tRNA synthetase